MLTLLALRKYLRTKRQRRNALLAGGVAALLLLIFFGSQLASQRFLKANANGPSTQTIIENNERKYACESSKVEANLPAFVYFAVPALDEAQAKNNYPAVIENLVKVRNICDFPLASEISQIKNLFKQFGISEKTEPLGKSPLAKANNRILPDKCEDRDKRACSIARDNTIAAVSCKLTNTAYSCMPLQDKNGRPAARINPATGKKEYAYKCANLSCKCEAACESSLKYIDPPPPKPGNSSDSMQTNNANSSTQSSSSNQDNADIGAYVANDFTTSDSSADFETPPALDGDSWFDSVVTFFTTDDSHPSDLSIPPSKAEGEDLTTCQPAVLEKYTIYAAEYDQAQEANDQNKIDYLAWAPQALADCLVAVRLEVSSQGEEAQQQFLEKLDMIEQETNYSDYLGARAGRNTGFSLWNVIVDLFN
ncbi:MAG: hypothetical protein HYZ62_00395 [Candidatus Andersenbacteria bacterium]|nr:hypothetical protein [Candidatus Andersenbacteria bacterium]